MQRESVIGPAGPDGHLAGGGPRRLRVAVVAESFLPTANRITRSVCRTLEHLSRRGHDAVLICPGPAPSSFAGAPVVGVPSFSRRRQSPVGLPGPAVIRTLAAFAPDIVHLASPFVLGSAGVIAAGRLGLPTVAVFGPDPGRRRDGTPGSRPGGPGPLAWRWIRSVHQQAQLTLATSQADFDDLAAHAVPGLRLWQPQVDTEQFSPRRRAGAAAAARHAELAPNGEVLVGHSGRLATRTHQERLAALAGLPGVRLVLVGGPRPDPAGVLARTGAAHVDPVGDDDLADVLATLDVMVRTGDELPDGAGDPGHLDRRLHQAMSTGVPVVVPDWAATPAAIAPGLNGLLHPGGHDDTLRGAVAALTADAEQRRWMGAAARSGVERSNAECLGDELIVHYRSVVRQRPVRL